MSLILHFTYMLMSIDRSCHLHVTSSGSATSIVHVSDDNSQKPEDLPGKTYQHGSASFRRTARAINTLPPLARTPRVLGMENSFTVKKERKGSQLVRTVSVLSKAHFLLQKDSKPPSCPAFCPATRATHAHDASRRAVLVRMCALRMRAMWSRCQKLVRAQELRLNPT